MDLSTTSSAKVAVVRGEIYAIEVNSSTKVSTIKRFDVERCSWQTVLSSHEGCREDSCIVAAGNHLYVCGGWLGGEYFSKAERFDTVENKWEEIGNMQQVRGYAFGAATEGKVFVAGGTDDWKSWGTCEIYNISSDEWQFIGNLTAYHMYGGSVVCLNATLYVLGGTDVHGESQLSVECYDPTEDKWMEKATIPVEMICKCTDEDTFIGCLLKLSKGVLDKLDDIKE